MDFETLSWLQSAPSKKYVRKLLEFAYLFKNKLYSFEELMETPVSSQMPQDLGLNEKQTHQVHIFPNYSVDNCDEQKQWQAEEIASQFPQGFNPQLSQLLIDTVIAISPLCDRITNREICQADALVDLDWRLDVQIQTHNQQKVNQPILFLQFETLNVQTNQKNNVTVQMNASEVNNLHKNLKKIKDQLTTIVSQ